MLERIMRELREVPADQPVNRKTVLWAVGLCGDHGFGRSVLQVVERLGPEPRFGDLCEALELQGFLL
jgi:hypothetical protein